MAPASRRPSSQSSSLPNPPLSARKGNVPARPHMTQSPSLESQPSGASMASAPSGHLATRAPSFSSTGSGGSDNIKVAVRLRPFSDKERSRGDREVWGLVGPNTVGVTQQVGIRVRYSYDTVFSDHATNSEVYSEACRPVVEAALDGFNGTVFAYGVTSSGKTHTITGTRQDPGFVQRTLEDVFQHVAAQPDREHLLGLSIMEIYNEELRDLLDPTRHLKLREDPKQGFFVEGGKEETVVSLEHALAVVHVGQHYRTTSATMMNTDSSRSHTIMRLRVESSPRPTDDSDPLGMQPRTLSFLNIIDLAGSESAKVSLSKGQSREGAFINRSLLTLGTVISKLSEGHAAHVPFRDSKLTRLLCSSLSGSGAKVAVIATITPASSQAEETHNTLKFATRAKKVEVKAERNQIEDQSSLLLRYQQEIEALRAQLDDQVRANRDAVVGVHDPLHPEVRNLQERLEEEHQALLAREADVAAMHGRIGRLTQLIIRAVRSQSLVGEDSLERRHLLRAYWRPPPVPNQLEGPALSSRHQRDPALQTEDLASSVAAIRCAGDIFPGERLAHSLMQSSRARGNEQEVLSQQVLVMADELEEQLSQLNRLRRLQTARPSSFAQASPLSQALRQASLVPGAQGIGALPLTSSMSLSTKLAAHVRALQQQHQAVVEARAGQEGTAAPRLSSDLRGVEEAQPGRENEVSSAGGPAKPRRFTSEMLEQLSVIDQEVTDVMAAEADRDAAVVQHTQLMTEAQGEIVRLEQHTVDLADENAALRAESDRLEARDAALQGYGLDDMHNDQLSQLILTLTQAVERVRITVQLRRLQAAAQASAEPPQPENGEVPSPAPDSFARPPPDESALKSPFVLASARTSSEQPSQDLLTKSSSGRFNPDGGNADRLAALRRLSSQRSGIPGPPPPGTARMSSD